MSCPIKMADGRYFTNYEPRCVRNANLNELLNKNNIINSSYEQRLFLQQNSQMIWTLNLVYIDFSHYYIRYKL